MRFVLALAVIVAGAAPARAGRATCSNPGLPVGATSSRDLLPGQLSLSLTTSMLPIHSDEVLDEGAGPLELDEHLLVLETRFSAEYALTPWLAIGGSLPYRMIDVGVVHRDPATGDEVPAPNEIHVRDETLKGVGDPGLGVHLAREVAGWRLHGRAGVTLPAGGTVEDPHLLGSIGQEHEHIQLGTGIVIPYVALEAQHTFASGIGPVTVAGWALTYLALYDNSKGYRPGDRYSGGLDASASFGLRSWTFGVALEGHGETAETWDGMVYTTEGNAGRFDLLAGANVSWRPLPRLAVIADLKHPVYSHVDGTQLDYGFVFGLGVATTIETRKRAAYRGLDHRVVADPGTAADLVPVPGKITAFDLWATWCAPCRELDDKLEALARAHPDKLAVRKLDVVDPDSPAWKRHLAPGSFELPHLKVYGADGKLMFEKTAPPAELIRALEAVLR